MYKIEDVVVYGLHGVCRITEITEKEFAGESHLYYTMHPVFNDRSTFFVPADNEKSKVKVRDLLSVEEVHTLILSMPSQEEIEIINEKQRKDIYKSIVESGDRVRISRLIKTIYLRNKAREQEGKKQHLIDERFMRDAEAVLFDEFAYVLSIDRDKVTDYIREKLNQR